MKLTKLSYQRYEIATGPAAGTVLERSTNPQALPCYRWMVIDGVRPLSASGFTLRGLAAACEAHATASKQSQEG